MKDNAREHSQHIAQHFAACAQLQEADAQFLEHAKAAYDLAVELEDYLAQQQARWLLARHYHTQEAYHHVLYWLEPLLEPPFVLDAVRKQNVLYELSRAAAWLDEVRKTIRYASELLAQLGEGAQDDLARIDIYDYLGSSLTRLGAYHDALEYYQRQLNLLNAIEQEWASPYIGIGWINNALDNHHAALAYLEEGLRIATQQEDTYQLGRAYNHMGSVYELLEEHQKAVEYYQRSLRVAQAQNYARGVAVASANLGNNYFRLGNAKQAKHYYEQARSYLHDSPSAMLAGWLSIHMGELILEEDFARGEALLISGLETVKQRGGIEGVLHGHKLLYHAYEARRRFADALEHYKAYSKLKLSKLEDMHQRRTQALSVQFEVERLRQEQERYKLKNAELSLMIRQLEEVSIRDSLTNLYNRRYFDAYITQAFEEAKQTQQPLGIILADIDHFKNINDTFSHSLGDEVLRTLARILEDVAGDTYMSARYGGEEFVMACKECDTEKSRHIAETIRQRVLHYPWHVLHKDLTLTISLGVFADATVSSYQQMIDGADRKLYEAKNGGKNQVCA